MKAKLKLAIIGRLLQPWVLNKLLINYWRPYQIIIDTLTLHLVLLGGYRRGRSIRLMIIMISIIATNPIMIIIVSLSRFSSPFEEIGWCCPFLVPVFYLNSQSKSSIENIIFQSLSVFFYDFKVLWVMRT
mgnify:CR=1 FL=1